MTVTTTTTIKDEVIKADPKQKQEKDPSYIFGNGRKFESTDDSDSGIYDGT